MNKAVTTMTHQEILKGIASAGFHKRYGEKPGKEATLRYLWEMKHITEAGFQDYYIMAYWIFNFYKPEDLDIWAFGAMNSSVICYSLGLTKVDPVKYGLQSARFVNIKRPQFQFDIPKSRYDEFMKRADEILQSNIAAGFDAPGIRASLLGQASSFACLDRKRARTVPNNIDDEVALYTLKTPNTMDIYDTYVRRMNGEVWEPTGVAGLDEILAPTRGLLIYQEQVMEILSHYFHVSDVSANLVRVIICRMFTKGEEEPLEEYKTKLFTSLNDETSVEDAEKAWELITTTPHTYMKAHTVSRVLLGYHYEFLAV